MDYTKKKKKSNKIYFWLYVIIVLGIMAIAILWEQSALNSETVSLYDNYIERAERLWNDDAEMAVVCYYKAIKEAPSKADAYLGMLDMFGRDGKFTEEERVIWEDLIQETLIQETLIQKTLDAKDGWSVMYKTGCLYFFYADDDTAKNKRVAKSYFEEAQKVMYYNYMEYNQRLRLKRMCELSDVLLQILYYESDIRAYDDSEVIEVFDKLWICLDEMSRGDLASEEGEYTALYIYREVLRELEKYAKEFKKAGLEKQQLNDRIDNIEEKLQEDSLRVDEQNDSFYSMELKRELEELVASARKAVKKAYKKNT